MQRSKETAQKGPHHDLTPREVHAGHGRGERHLKSAVHNSPSVISLRRVHLVDVQWIRVARKLGKCGNIGSRDLALEFCLEAGLQVTGVKHARLIH